MQLFLSDYKFDYTTDSVSTNIHLKENFSYKLFRIKPYIRININDVTTSLFYTIIFIQSFLIYHFTNFTLFPGTSILGVN